MPNKTYRRNRRAIAKAPVKNKVLNCSPAVKNKTIRKGSCLTSNVILKIKDEYNKDHPTNKILATKPALVWHELRMRLDCEDERCWVNQIDNVALRNQIKKQIFAPEHPPSWFKNKNEWLSNFDINAVMAQYETKFPDFKYLGTTPIDYDFIMDKNTGTCVENNLCRFNLKQLLSQGKKRYASVFNTDPHNKPGMHWISLFVDIPRKTIMYFDSARNEYPPNIQKLVETIQEQGTKLKIPLKYLKNEITHQSGGSECGMYSIHFIAEMLERPDQALKKFMHEVIPDKAMEEKRKEYFSSPE